MSAAEKLPAKISPADENAHPPVITLIGADIPPEYLDEAEPSHLLDDMGRVFRGFVKLIQIGVVIALVAGYPAAIINAHKVDTSPVILSPDAPWASAQIGTALTLIGREMTNGGWAEDRTGWHPKAQLTALPAWQDGLSSALSSYAGLLASLTATDGTADPDLMAASRLLAPASDIEATPRVNAAAEALQRYDGRLSRNLAQTPDAQVSFVDSLDLYAEWMRTANVSLDARVGVADGWPAARTDITAIYQARAHAHVAAELMSAALIADPSLVTSARATTARDEALRALRRTSSFNPIVVSNDGGNSRFLSDHPAMLATYTQQAQATLESFKLALDTQNADAVTIAEADVS